MFLEPRAAPSRRQAWARETSFELLGYLYFGHVGPGTTIGNLSTPKPPSERTSAYKRAQFMGAPSHAEVTVSRIDTRHRLAVIAHEDTEIFVLEGRRYEQALTTEVLSFLQTVPVFDSPGHKVDS